MQFYKSTCYTLCTVVSCPGLDQLGLFISAFPLNNNIRKLYTCTAKIAHIADNVWNCNYVKYILLNVYTYA